MQALELLMKYMGMLDQRIQLDANINTSHDVNIRLEELSIEELKVLGKVSGVRYQEEQEVIDCIPLVEELEA